MEHAEAGTTVQSVERTFSIIEELSRHPKGICLLDLSKAVSLNKSTVHRLLGTLARMGYVTQGEDNAYRLTLRFCEISDRVLEGIDLIEVAKPYLKDLCDITQETVHLVVRQGNEIVYVHKLEHPSLSMRMVSHIGMRRSLISTAVGKSIMATLTDEEITRIWNDSQIVKYTPNTIDDLGVMLNEIDRVRARGYAIDNEENERGVRCIGAAIFDRSKRSSAALSVSAPVGHMSDERVLEIAPRLISIGQSISHALGYRK